RRGYNLGHAAALSDRRDGCDQIGGGPARAVVGGIIRTLIGWRPNDGGSIGREGCGSSGIGVGACCAGGIAREGSVGYAAIGRVDAVRASPVADRDEIIGGKTGVVDRRAVGAFVVALLGGIRQGGVGKPPEVA